MVSRIMGSPTPNDVHILIPKTLPEKRDFEDMIKDFEIGRLSWIFRVGPMKSQGPYKREKTGVCVSNGERLRGGEI